MKPLIISVGEPAGIGPDILLKLTQHRFPQPIVVITDSNLLDQRAKQLGIPFNLPHYDAKQPAPFSIIHQPTNTPVIAGQPNEDNAHFVLACLDHAIQGCLSGEFAALVTGPVNKAVIQKAGVHFLGHTDYLANKTNTPHAVMMFTNKHWRLALVTTHIPLSQVAKSVTHTRVTRTIETVHQALIKQFNVKQPHLAVTGLNPHAGENGYLGQEETTTIKPALAQLRQKGLNLTGPLSADTIFHWAESTPVDAIISMYHDQSLPVLKALDFGGIVNVTLGLPIIRTSVDHGTAFELAGTGQADETSLVNATQLAIKLSL